MAQNIKEHDVLERQFTHRLHCGGFDIATCLQSLQGQKSEPSSLKGSEMPLL